MAGVQQCDQYTNNAGNGPPIFPYGLNVAQQELQLDEWNNFGSTDTNVVGFSTTTINVGTAISFATTPAHGTIITINVSGIYAITAALGDVSGGSTCMCVISVNATGSALTSTDPVDAVADANRLAFSALPSVSSQKSNSSCTRVSYRTAGDLIRVHSNNTTTLLSGSMVSVIKIA